jgi:PAS domain S-box-containing protein
MSSKKSATTGVERTFDEDDIIVSKTDLKGKIVYANDLFLNISDYSEDEVLGQPHSMIRHPDMPRCLFNLLWSTIQSGNEIFAYVVNRTKHGDHYWVNAHVTPTLDADNNVIGYHSNRRAPTQQAMDVIKPLYKKLVAAENNAPDRKQGLETSSQMLSDFLKEKDVEYERFVLAL